MLYRTAKDVQKALLLDTPKRCPRCDSKVKKYNVDGEKVVMCKNNKCPWPLCLVENAENSKLDQDPKSDQDGCEGVDVAKITIETGDSLGGNDYDDADDDKANVVVQNEITTTSNSLDFSQPCKTILSSDNLSIGYNGEHVIISYLVPATDTEHEDGKPPTWIQFPEVKVEPGAIDHVVTLIQEFSQELTIKYLRQKDPVVQYTTEAAIAKQFLSKDMINDLRNLLSTKTLRSLLPKREIVKHKRMEKPIKVKESKPIIFMEPNIKERKPKQKPIILIEPNIKERKPKRPKIPVNLIIQQILKKDFQAMEKMSKKIQTPKDKEEKKHENIPLQPLKVDACNIDDHAAANSVKQFKRSLLKKLLRKAGSCKKQPRYQKSFKGPPGPPIGTPGTVPLDFVDINNLESGCLESESLRNRNISGDLIQNFGSAKRRRGRPSKNRAQSGMISLKEEFDRNAYKSRLSLQNKAATGIKRKRGRPRKSFVQNTARDSQQSIWNDTNEDTKHNVAHEKRGRGRPRKSEASRTYQYVNKLLLDTDNVPLTNIRQMMFCKNISEEDMAFRLKGNLAAQASRSYSRGKSRFKLENMTAEADS